MVAEARQDVGDDGGGVLGAGIVGGDDGNVRPTVDGGGHFGALGTVAVAAAPEDAEDAAFGEGTQGGEDVGEGVVGVGVVHEDMRGHGLQTPPAGFGRGDGHQDGVDADAEGLRGRGGAEDVGQVVTSAEGGAEGDAAATQGHLGLGAGGREGGLGRGGGVGEDVGAAREQV